MTKNDLVNAVAAEAGVTKGVATKVLDAIGSAVTVALRSGDEVVLPEIGKFTRKTRAARQGMNLHTKERIQIPSKRLPHFKAAKALSDAVA